MLRYFFLFILSSFTLFAQKGVKQSLITIQFDKGDKESLKQSVYMYNYNNSSFVSKEKIMTLEGKKDGKDYMRFDVGDITFYKNRYMISSSGDVVDLESKVIMYDGNARLVRCSNDSVILYINDVFLGKLISFYSIQTNKYSEIKDETFKGLVRQNIEIDRSKAPYKLIYVHKNQPKETLMPDAGRGEVSATNTKNNIPIYWLDDYTFLFPKMKVSNLEGSIVKYNITTKTAKEFGVFNSATNMPLNFKIDKGMGKAYLEFYFKDKMYLINPTKETMLLVNYKDYENNFSVEVVAKANNGKAVYYKGKEIGKEHFELNKVKPTLNYFAAIKEIKIDDEVAQQGIVLYNVEKKVWEKIQSEDVLYLVGWILR